MAAQVAFLQQQMSQLRGENSALKKALAAEGGQLSFDHPDTDQQWQVGHTCCMFVCVCRGNIIRSKAA